MTCAIIDDEPLAAELLASYAQKTTFLELVGTYNSAIEAMKVIRTTPVDLLFLDIQMPELSGLEFATILSPKTMIVFTTAFDRYAVESYKVNAIDYLLKPIAYDAFLHSANKALQMLETRSTQKSVKSEERFFYVKSEYKLIRILIDDILYIEGQKDYVKIRLAAPQKSVNCLMNMKALEDYLPQQDFMRVHRSYIVNLKRVEAIDRLRVVIGDTFIPISDTYKDAVTQFIASHTVS
ncbi:MAG: LytTR family DNA-binding domain-containing protein [Prevotellaceae bacterium]|nr:LytTR family DNA-binding domain-containing protein [Prevotellaceae bacterium]MDY2749820.1 LytTR family DNA-binding domain-containing protein [Prevotella sp.]